MKTALSLRWIVASLLIIASRSSAGAAAPVMVESTSPGDLPALVRAAASDYTPFSPQEVAAVRNSLASRVTRLNEYLTPGGENGRAWKAYLKWDDLAELLADGAELDKEKVGKLRAVHRLYRANHIGLEMPVFFQVAEALRRYIDVVNIARRKDGQDQYAQLIDRLAADLEKYIAEPDEATASNIGPRLGFIEGVGQSPHVVAAVRRQLARPNLHVTVATALIDAGVTRPVRRAQHVTDCILGTSISGTATSDGLLRIGTVPCLDHAHVQLILSGTIDTDTVGENGPVCIYAAGATSFCMTKDVHFLDRGPRVCAATASARTCSNIHCIQTKRGGVGSRLIERAAWRRAGKQKSQAEAIAAQHAEQRMSAKFDLEVAPRIDKFKANYDNKFRLPLVRRGEMPKRLDFATTDRSVAITALQANRSQLGAPTPPPAIGAGHDLAVRVHESLPNNVAGAFIAGFTLTDKLLKKKVIELRGELPPELQDEGEDPWSVEFKRVRPVSVSFSNGGFTVTIRGKRFSSGDRQCKDLNITAAYKFEARPEGIVLVRQGNVEILPPGFDREKGRLSAEQSALRGVLIKRLAKLFKPEIPAEGLELPGEMKKLGRLVAGEISSEDGWLTIGWNRAK